MGGCISTRRQGEVSSEAQEKKEDKIKPPAAGDIVDLKKTPHKYLAHRKDEEVALGLRTDFGHPRDFGERYSLGKELGHGQFGTTYVCVDKKTGENLACKAILKKQVTCLADPFDCLFMS